MTLFNRWRKPKKLELRLEQSQEPEPTRHYLNASPKVVDGLEAFETKMGGPGYVTVATLVSQDPLRKTMTRWTLTPEARAAVADGADIYLELLTYGRPMQPILISVAEVLDRGEIAEEYGITPEKRKDNGEHQRT